jgi:hypothetical protein
MRIIKLLPILMALTLVGGMTIPAVAAPQLQAGNLLQNPSFSSGTDYWDTWAYQVEIMQTDDKKQPDLELSYYAPDFITSEPKWDMDGNGTAGSTSGKEFKKFRAGFRQTVDVPAGARVQLTGKVNGYCEDDQGASCAVILKLGIDPTGGIDWQSGSVQWVETQVNSNNPTKYAQLATGEVTVGPGGKVTVFTWGEPSYPFRHNAAYFDGLNLAVTAAAPATTPTAAPAAPTPQPVQPAAPAAPAQPAACAQLRWVADVTIPDGTAIAPGTQFIKTWKVKNNGTCAFAGTLNFIGTGNQMGGASPVTLPKIDPGQQADISINLTAPAQVGDQQGTWQPRTSDGTAMENLIVKIKVQANAPAPVAAVTATPQGQASPTPAPTPTPATGQLCILAYNDRNGDLQQDTDENLLAGVVFTLSDVNGPRESYTTDGVSEPHCFTELPPGSYSISAKPPANYSVTTEKTTVVALNGGMKTDILTGARRGGPVPTATQVGGASSGATGSSLLGSAGRVILIVVLVLILIGLGFGGGFLLMTRRL